ncbi:tRNA (adenosine(37)-N6)-dimethylallyltransferase MiaA [Sulfurovum sp. NBC37-1]|uniref:tRNA dimethylallyltransferase n=1 Tax=Sulfurovum sp. (strain NBC37-1) TaxID=387093 RepID=MIAA_SULNB|nr:tRNA (adenosine(37)-N6)-dimethylallyltransferase MiaA [Sulfurovum sp. NBC37-1]A6QCE8.1 RecName: Full=tRNA dimethylallyltransferase; AltName: Full=Dimethylallyl diphosphate:tRNA dimethylallyltransferase; Short=DMAPP:tRNA dimethylallyltransferase; Short=DMATase; AltName: Full=Isopentenyl-diphosphate:tRNA isopentenyltransferase; Short=IPP transferase; Short=IPPT; Short=IPTase [Sulfurovum sp. NBC37-1]BAF73157.1 tRNA delta(2)-isopentenylpyrophosphate transferase [Sulfurovum sp. NBC37-1]
MNQPIRQLALIGPTASGKTALAIKAAQALDAHILSIDSLSIYKEIDIVSAKPTKEEQKGIKHFGIDFIAPNEDFDVTTFIRLYEDVHVRAVADNKNLVIVGGTSFYLKMLMEGISKLPKISETTKRRTTEALRDLQKSHEWLSTLDPDYMQKISSSDPYRIEKALDIYFETGTCPTEYFKAFPPKPTIQSELPIYQIETDRELLRKRISLRTQMMLEDGLIDEICMLEEKYTRAPNCMKAIGIKETLAYLDGIYEREMLKEKITVNTARLAKRQTTFNHSQFDNVIKGSVSELEKILLQGA